VSSVWNKIDPGLGEIYSDYLRAREGGPGKSHRLHRVVEAGGRPHVFVYFTAELEELEALGFECAWREDENRALGTIDLADLERLAAHPGVHRIVFGRERKPLLDISVPDIRANLLRTRTGDVFSPGTGAGAGAIVGIIDTGIMFSHPFFLAAGSSNTTRIRRIWDQGLTPTGSEKSPDPALLGGGPGSYGVEYTDADINAVFKGTAGAPPVRHLDYHGHGTHVASIAAGDGRKDFKFVGVAPRAELVVVKIDDLESEPKINGNPVSESQRFRDAVEYILNVRSQLATPAPPVVINYSFGDHVGPHDGLTDDEDWLASRFVGATGRVFVGSAGNNASARQHARIELPAATEVNVPLDLTDKRTDKSTYRAGKEVDGSESLSVHLWYRSGGPTLAAKLELPYLVQDADAPALGDPVTSDSFGFLGRRTYKVGHSVESMPLRLGGTVARNHFFLEVLPRGDSHETGTYTLKLTASAALTVHLWCSQPEPGQRFEVGTPTPPEVHVEDRFLVTDPGGARHIITVAATDAKPPGGRPIAYFSSRGPLASYGGVLTPPSKPDLAAPGYQIEAAKSAYRKPPSSGPTVRMNGTSMSAPFVTGTVALMLAKKPTLTAADAASILCLEAAVSDVVDNAPPVAADSGAGRLNAERAFKAVPP
jgi:subtilisin family serine protease